MIKFSILLVILVLTFSCSAPINYINNLPGTSGLEQKGDFNVKANMGADWRVLDDVYDLDMAWSPVKSLGVKTHLTGKGSSNYFSRLVYRDISLVYYKDLKNGMQFELVGGSRSRTDKKC
ncbi:MAG: hypothetical protein JXR03_14630 [Cyclobacteriaceae bacterium]